VSTLETTRRPVAAQVLVCLGCCCGRTDRGRPELPLDWLKAEWKAHGLLKTVHLTVSGCLGPCERANVVVLWTPEQSAWLGPLTTREDYQAVLEWAQDTTRTGSPAPVPASLTDRCFERWQADRA
jgi:predicted metal-binding protein